MNRDLPRFFAVTRLEKPESFIWYVSDIRLETRQRPADSVFVRN